MQRQDEAMSAFFSVTKRRTRWHYGWVIVANGFLVEMVVMGTALYAYSVFVLPFAREFGTGVFEAMLGLTGFYIAVAIFSPLAGQLVSTGSIKRYMILGLCLLGVGFTLLSYATTLWQVIALYSLFIGFGYAFVAPIAASAVIANWFTALQGRALSIAAIGTSFGGLVLPVLAAYIISTVDWRTAFQAFGLLYFILAIPVVWLLVVNYPAEKALLPYGEEKDQTNSADNHESPSPKLPLPGIKKILSARDFWLISISIGGCFAVFIGVTENIVPYATTLGYTEQQGAFFISLLTASAMIGKVGFAWVTDHIGLRNTFWTALGLDLISLGFLVSMPTYATFFISVICLGLSSGGMLPLWPGFIGFSFGRDALAKVMGLTAPIVNACMMLAPPFAGLMFDIFGDYRKAFIVFFGILLVAVFASRNLGRQLN